MSSFELTSMFLVVGGILASVFNLAVSVRDKLNVRQNGKLGRSAANFWMTQDVIRLITLTLFLAANVESVSHIGQVDWTALNTIGIKALFAAEVALFLNAIVGTSYFFRLNHLIKQGNIR